MDIRIQRSQLHLWQAFFKLMTKDKQAFSSITINQICESALVHRSTFYKHFEDKYALLDYGLVELFNPYWQLDNIDKIHKPFVTAANFFYDSQAEQLLEAQSKDENFYQLLQEKSSQQMIADYSDYYQGLELNDLPISLLVKQSVMTIFSLSQWQKEQTESISPATLDQYFQLLRPTIQ